MLAVRLTLNKLVEIDGIVIWLVAVKEIVDQPRLLAVDRHHEAAAAWVEREIHPARHTLSAAEVRNGSHSVLGDVRSMTALRSRERTSALDLTASQNGRARPCSCHTCADTLCHLHLYLKT